MTFPVRTTPELPYNEIVALEWSVRLNWRNVGMQNPYRPPAWNSGPDWNGNETRKDLAASIREFLNREISTFQFEDRLESFFDSSDPVVSYFADSLWVCVSDCPDQLISFSKQEWDYLQRVLLVLESDCRLQVRSKTSWSFRQIVAAIALSFLGYFAIQLGWNVQLLFLAVPCGGLSLALTRWGIQEDCDEPYHHAIYPFATFSDLATAYRETGFRKTRFSRHLSIPAKQSVWAEWSAYACSIPLWLAISPFVLLFQSFPNHECTTRVVVNQ